MLWSILKPPPLGIPATGAAPVWNVAGQEGGGQGENAEVYIDFYSF